MTTVPTDVDRRFREAAAEAGLLDDAYDLTDSPVGHLLVASGDRGLCRRAWRDDQSPSPSGPDRKIVTIVSRPQLSQRFRLRLNPSPVVRVRASITPRVSRSDAAAAKARHASHSALPGSCSRGRWRIV